MTYTVAGRFAPPGAQNQGVNASGGLVLDNGGGVRRRRVTPVVRRTYADLDNATVEGVWRTNLTPALRSRRSITALMLAVDRNAVSSRHSASCSGGVLERCSISRRTPAASDRVRFAVSADELFS